MQESIEKKKEKLKPYRYKKTIKPIFKPIKHPEVETVAIPKISVTRKKEQKPIFIAPQTVNPPKVESKTASLPIFKSEKPIEKSISGLEIKSIAMEIKAEREVKERLKGTVEELVSEPQKLKALSSKIKKPEETVVKTDFDSSIHPIEQKEILFPKTPEIKLMQFIPSALITDFDKSPPKIEFKERVRAVPKLSIAKLPEVTTRNYFDKTISPEVISKIEMVEEVEKEEKEITPTVEMSEKEGITALEVSGKEKEELEFPNFFEFLFGKGAGKISKGKPICIIVPKTKERYEELIATLCREIYREKKGGKPTPIYRETIEELRREFEPRVEGEIVVVENVEKTEKGYNEYLLKILKGFFSLDIGFLILVTDNSFELEKEIRKVPSAKTLVIDPTAELKIFKEELLRIIRGKESLTQAESFGEEFKGSIEEFDNELVKRYLDYKKAPWDLKQDWDRLTACSSDDNEEASEEHSAMKAFVWLYEWKKYGKRKEIVPALEEKEGNRIVDVKIEDRNYEIETLFGVGDVMDKLTRKVKNYSTEEEIYFVLRNVDILRNLSLLSSFKNNWRKQKYQVEFFGLDLDKQNLIPLIDIAKKLKDLGKKQIEMEGD